MCGWICKWENMKRWRRDAVGKSVVHRGKRGQWTGDIGIYCEMLWRGQSTSGKDGGRDSLNEGLELVHPILEGSGAF
jgi:hypothetical protein